MTKSISHAMMADDGSGKPSFERGDDSPLLALDGRPKRSSTHGTERVGEIAIVAPDGVRRVPFSVVLAADASILVLSFLPDESTSLDRFDRQGHYLGEVARFSAGSGPGQLLSPAGIAVDDAGAIYVPDADRHRIVKFDPRGRFVAELGAEGTADGEVLGPRDVEIGDGGRLLVADTENHRVQVWEPDGSFVVGFGAEVNEDDESPFLPKGSRPGEFFRPLGVSFDNEGRLVVADTNNHRVQRLSIERGFDLQFGGEGLEAGALSFPIDVRIDRRGRAVVADVAGTRVQWFSPEGRLECAITLEGIMPQGATVADVDVDDDGVIFIPVGPLGRVYMARAGAPHA